jgi:hypothetical protein
MSLLNMVFSYCIQLNDYSHEPTNEELKYAPKEWL